jgi:hypothetical protein
MQHPKKRCSSKRRTREPCKLVELYRLAENIARKEKEDPRDVLYDLTGEWTPVKTHGWDEF